MGHTEKHKSVTTPSLSTIARESGVSRGTLAAWKAAGVDVADPSALAARIALKQCKPSPPAGDAESYTQARTRREIAAANRMETLAAKERGELTPAAENKAEGIRIGTLVRQSLDRAARADLPPLLAGRTAAEISTLLVSYFYQLCVDLSAYQSPVSFNEDNPEK